MFFFVVVVVMVERGGCQEGEGGERRGGGKNSLLAEDRPRGESERVSEGGVQRAGAACGGEMVVSAAERQRDVCPLLVETRLLLPNRRPLRLRLCARVLRYVAYGCVSV